MVEYDTRYHGLANNGRNNCYLNVVIQSLWHLISFRINFMGDFTHKHSDRELLLRRKRCQLATKTQEEAKGGDEEILAGLD